jgi:hypothetical protein
MIVVVLLPIIIFGLVGRLGHQDHLDYQHLVLRYHLLRFQIYYLCIPDR